MYRWYSRAVSNQAEVMLVRVLWCLVTLTLMDYFPRLLCLNSTDHHYHYSVLIHHPPCYYCNLYPPEKKIKKKIVKTNPKSSICWKFLLWGSKKSPSTITAGNKLNKPFQVQENNLVHIFEDMTNALVLSVKPLKP